VNLAWGTVLLILLVLPGFAFVFSFYTNSRSSRDATPKSASAELAVVVALAFAFHFIVALLLAILNALFALVLWLAHVHDSPGMFGGLILGVKGIRECEPDIAPCDPITLFLAHPWAFLTVGGYLLATILVGYFLGYWLITRIETKWMKRLRFLHGWAGDFFVAKERHLIKATALTDISHNGLIVAYTGWLDDLHLNRERNIENLVLVSASKLVFDLSKEGLTELDGTNAAVAPLARSRIDEPLLFIDGKRLRNLTFEKRALEIEPSAADVQELADAERARGLDSADGSAPTPEE
jgi:hypothetical protein